MRESINPKDYGIKLPKNIKEIMNEQYSFSSNDNDIKKTSFLPVILKLPLN